MPRKPSQPPDIEGFSAVRLIGVGGYADVFLYEQHMPSRFVAVKVLVADVLTGDQQRRQFTAEANLMARVSTHPYIVSVFQAAIARDGRPYIVMEYYPGSNHLDRARRERLSLAEVLRTGIHVAGAVETAHRAGILHRDIKPANILTSEYGRPGLTDFGIAFSDGSGDGDGGDGLSVPWAPPEAFDVGRTDERGDVYSLAATVYHLLAGRSPFEVGGALNSPLELMDRIERAAVPPIGRPDVPPALEQLLWHAMAKNPEHRPPSAAQLGRLLQGVEAEMKLVVTQLELVDDGNSGRRQVIDDQDDDATRVRGVKVIDPHLSPAVDVIESIPSSPMGMMPVAPRGREGLLAEPVVDETEPRPNRDQVPTESTPAPQRVVRARWAVAAALLMAAVIVGVIVVIVAGDGEAGESSTATFPELANDGVDDGGSIAIATAPPPVTDLEGVANVDGTFAFTWARPDDVAIDIQFQVTESATSDRNEVTHPPQPDASFTSEVPCIEVVALTSKLASAPTFECVAT